VNFKILNPGMQQVKTLVTIFVCLHLPKDNGPTFFLKLENGPTLLNKLIAFFASNIYVLKTLIVFYRLICINIVHLLQVRSMKLSKDVRNQLCQIIKKIAKGQFSSFYFIFNP